MREVIMEVITEYVDHRAELEERIRSLESEQTTLTTEISSLKEKLTTLELERHANSLSNEVEALRTEKAVLEEKISTYSSPIDQTESYKVSLARISSRNLAALPSSSSFSFLR